jgi:FkbM family methyltransferase
MPVDGLERMPFKRTLRVFHNVLAEWRASAKLSSDVRSCLRLSADFLLSHFQSALPSCLTDRMRQVRSRSGVTLCYRLNRGDLQSIREVWFEEAYRLPFPDPCGVLLDLGANIGLTSLWMAKRYPFKRIIAVEPEPRNAALIRRNFELNGIKGEVLEAAVGARDGAARFQVHRNSNQGKLSESGVPVAMVSVNSILERFALPQLDLVKIDIEGGEQELFRGLTAWLDRTKAIIIEFHPTLVDYPLLTKLLEDRGFDYIRANTAFPNNMDCFWRSPASVHGRDFAH